MNSTQVIDSPETEIEVNREEIGKNYSRVTKIKVSQKCLTIISEINKEHIIKLVFRKRSSGGVEELGFNVSDERPEIKKAKCNLGHEHVIEQRMALKEYAHIGIPWQHAEQVMEWFATGSWREVKNSRKDEE